MDLFSRGSNTSYTPLNGRDNATDVESLHKTDTAQPELSQSSRSISSELQVEIQQALPLSEKDLPAAGCHASRALAILQSTLLLLTPAVITWPIGLFTDRLRGTTGPPTRQGPTAYLDGLRGVAALIVYFAHGASPCFERLRYGYGARPEDTLFLQLPIVRVLHSGRASVAIFFVISGFVLTNKAISQIYQGKRHLVLNTLAGTTFRRPFRLFLPIAASTAVTALAVNLQMYQPFVSFQDTKELPKITFKKPPGSGTLLEQYYEWFGNLVGLIDAVRLLDHHDFNIRVPTRYNRALWTIPHEFRGSLFIVLIVLMFAYARRWVNAVAVAGLTLWLAYHDDGDNFLFAAGMLLAELSIILHTRSSPAVSLDGHGPRRPENIGKTRTMGSLAWKAVRHVCTILLVVLSLYFLSYPDQGGETSPGFITLSSYARPSGFFVRVFWPGVGAVLFVTALVYSPPTRLFGSRLPWHQMSAERPEPETDKCDAEPLLQQIFTTTFAQYLGRISYSLYLLHIPVNNIVGTIVMNPAIVAWRQALMDAEAKSLTASGREELLAEASTAYNISFFWAALINSLVLFWVSDVFTRLVDEQTVRFCRWITNMAWAPDAQDTAR